MNHKINKLVCIGATVMLGLNAFGDATIYNSFPNYNGNAFSLANGQEIGNEISLNTNIWDLNSFTLQYYSPDLTLSSSVGVDVRFYLNDGALTNGFASPGTKFFDSGWFYNAGGGGMPANGYQNVYYTNTDFYGGSLVNMTVGSHLPTDFTFTVSFTNLDLSNVVELPLANSPTGQPATSYGDYWRNDNGQWALVTNSVPANLTVQFTGSVPEPSIFCLGAIGSALLLGVQRLRKR